MGQKRSAVEDRMGAPLAAVQDSLVYQLMDIGYPIRLRLVFSNEELSDAYLYRGDF
jgi:hypothetical protein